MSKSSMHFPFSAVVGSDDMALALVLTTISPAVGGVLVRGEKGTAKSTTVRALASLLPPVSVVEGCRFSCDPDAPDAHCPDGPHLSGTGRRERPANLVELPVGATEDRVIGSLNLERALSDGVSDYEPGILAAAHRGLLYVDEVNLLHDHLVDLLLDAAAMGHSTVERDGVSVSHAARFVLVGTMNPEEGELRPQLLDRFGLTAEVRAPRDGAARTEVVRRRLAYEADPPGFVSRYRDQESAIEERIATARSRLSDVVLDDDALRKIAEVCAAFDVDGMRADIVTARAATAHAAWSGNRSVTRADIRAAARLAIPHRCRRNPFDSPGIDESLLDQILADDPPPEPPPEQEPVDSGPEPSTDRLEGTDGRHESSPSPSTAQAGTEEPSDGQADTTADGSPSDSSGDEASGEPCGAGSSSVTAPANAYRARRFTVAGAGFGEAGRRSRAITSQGRTVGVRRPDDATPGPIHLPATIRAAAPHLRDRHGGRLRFRSEDLRTAVREGRESNLVLLCVDASGSMAARRRMEQVKAAVLSLLLDAYRRRDKVGLITFRGDRADLALPPTSSVDIAATRLRDLPAGGRTPLAEGLRRAARTIEIERVRDPHRRPLLVVVTDGRATAGPNPVQRAHQAAAVLCHAKIASVVVDCETGRFRMGLGGQLAKLMHAEHVPVEEVSAEAITSSVRDPRHTGRTVGRAA